MKNYTFSLLLLLLSCGSNNSSSAKSCTLQDKSCSEAEYCKFPQGTCGTNAEIGVCEKKPEICAEVYGPVCGCDQKKYSNPCEAAGAGISILKTLSIMQEEFC